MFKRESRKVLDILKQLTLGGNPKTWIKGLKCGINSMQELQDHFHSTSEGAQRKQVCRSKIKKTFYNNETNFTFEKYITKLKVVFNVLEKYGVPLY